MTTRLHWLSRALCLIGILCTVTTTYVTEDSPAPAEKGVTFSHIYKIDLTKSPGCKLALQTMPHQQDQGLGLQELEGGPTLEGDKDIVFRHQINLKTSKCDCDESERFKSLLYRVIGLEEEVEHLKSQCSQGFCGGKGGGAGGTVQFITIRSDSASIFNSYNISGTIEEHNLRNHSKLGNCCLKNYWSTDTDITITVKTIQISHHVIFFF